MAWIVVGLPPAPFWKNQPAYEIAFGSTWRIAAASLIGFLCGEFVNSFVLAKMKILTRGRWRSEEHTSELQSHHDLVCRLLLEKKKKKTIRSSNIYKRYARLQTKQE